MKRLRNTRRLGALAVIRMCMVVSLVTISGGGVAYAALQTQEIKLTNNTITTATAGLQLSINGTTYSTSTPGYGFGSIVPGGLPSPTDGSSLYLRNSGQTALALKIYMPAAPTNQYDVDLSKVHIIMTPVGGGSIQNFTMQALVAAAATGGMPMTSASNMLAGVTQQYKIQISMDADAFNGPSAVLLNIDFAFVGTTVTS